MTFFSRPDAGPGYDSDDDLDDGLVPVTHEQRRAVRRRRIGWALISMSMLITVVLAFAPSPYVVETPGPVYNTLGSVTNNGTETQLITIDGAESYPTSGALDLLTVSVIGSPDRPASMFEVAMSWFDSSRSVQPVEKIYQPGITSDQQREQAQTQMQNSQQEAVSAALTELGYQVKGTVTVVSIFDGSGAVDVLQPGDVITSVDGQQIEDLPDLRALLAAHGTETDAAIGIDRDGQRLTVQIRPIERGGVVALGVGVQVSYDFPVDVSIELPNVGGPSAGMMFALGIYDKLTDGELTGGATVAGTGTIDAAGVVGPIGGIRQKMYGARQAGATLFLAPVDNCDEVVGNIPAGLDVVAVSTLTQALDDVKAVAAGTDPSTLQGCSTGS